MPRTAKPSKKVAKQPEINQNCRDSIRCLGSFCAKCRNSAKKLTAREKMVIIVCVDTQKALPDHAARGKTGRLTYTIFNNTQEGIPLWHPRKKLHRPLLPKVSSTPSVPPTAKSSKSLTITSTTARRSSCGTTPTPSGSSGTSSQQATEFTASRTVSPQRCLTWTWAASATAPASTSGRAHRLPASCGSLSRPTMAA